MRAEREAAVFRDDYFVDNDGKESIWERTYSKTGKSKGLLSLLSFSPFIIPKKALGVLCQRFLWHLNNGSGAA